MRPVIEEHDVTVYQGDVRDVLAGLPAESVNCVVTSPPYYGLRDYGCEGQIGLELSPAEYVETMRAVFAEVRRALRPDGVLWLNLGDTYSSRVAARASSHQDGLNGEQYGKDWKRDRAAGLTRMPTFLPEKNMLGIPWRVAFALQDDGWILRNDVIWHKTSGMPESVTDRLAKRHEHLFMFTRSRHYWFDLDAISEPVASTRTAALTWDRDAAKSEVPGQRRQHRPGRSDDLPTTRNPGDVWSIPAQPFPAAHFATFPPEIPRRCILAGCPEDGTVLDPFTGSGTTAMVARQLGRRFVGAELNPDYIDIIRQRIGQTPFDFSEAVS